MIAYERLVNNATDRGLSMLHKVEPRHVAEILSPFEHGDDVMPELAEMASQLGLPNLRFGQPIRIPTELQPDFELARRRLLDEAI